MKYSWWIDAGLAVLLAMLMVGIFLIRRRAPGARARLDAGGAPYAVLESLLPLKIARQAGFANATSLVPIVMIKLLGFIGLPLGWSELAAGEASVLSLTMAGAAGFLLPDCILWVLSRRRKTRITAMLSQFADFLVIMMRSGLTLNDALARVCDHGLPARHPLTRELRTTLAQMRAGQEWSAAFQRLAVDTGVQDLKRLSTTLEIGQRTGVPIVESLASKAELFREQYVQRIEKQLNRKSVEALLPILLLGIPMFAVLVFFPTGVQIYEAYTLFTNSW